MHTKTAEEQSYMKIQKKLLPVISSPILIRQPTGSAFAFADFDLIQFSPASRPVFTLSPAVFSRHKQGSRAAINYPPSLLRPRQAWPPGSSACLGGMGGRAVAALCVLRLRFSPPHRSPALHGSLRFCPVSPATIPPPRLRPLLPGRPAVPAVPA